MSARLLVIPWDQQYETGVPSVSNPWATRLVRLVQLVLFLVFVIAELLTRNSSIIVLTASSETALAVTVEGSVGLMMGTSLAVRRLKSSF